ncbi:MAG: methionine biosynthesis protein MetW [Anaerolineae bacterium]
MTNEPVTYAALRPDLQAVADLVRVGTKALDLGCGDGALLAYLVQQKQVRGRGIELSEAGVMACVRRGLSVRQGHLQEGLADYPTASFDVVILSQTLPFLDNPGAILAEMLRVGQRAIVSFPNWGYWRCRLELLVTGRVPLAPDLPQHWFDVPRWQALSITDFAQFCDTVDIRITREIYFNRSRRVRIFKAKNLLATTAVFMLQRTA